MISLALAPISLLALGLMGWKRDEPVKNYLSKLPELPTPWNVVKFRDVLIFVNEASAPYVLEDGKMRVLEVHMPTKGRWCSNFSHRLDN